MTIHLEHGDAVLLSSTVDDLVGLAAAGDVRLDYCDLGHLDVRDQWEVYRHLGCFLDANHLPGWVRALRLGVRGGEYRVTFLREEGSFEVVLDYGEERPWTFFSRVLRLAIEGVERGMWLRHMVRSLKLWDLDVARLPQLFREGLEPVRVMFLQDLESAMRGQGLDLNFAGGRRVELLLCRELLPDYDPLNYGFGIARLPNDFDEADLRALCARNMFPRTVLVVAERTAFGEIVEPSREGPIRISGEPGGYVAVLVGVEGAFSRALGRPTLFDDACGGVP